MNFRNLDFTNYNQIRSFIFKKNFYQHNNKYVESFDFLNYSKNLGGEIGINLSRKSIFAWFKINKNKIEETEARTKGCLFIELSVLLGIIFIKNSIYFVIFF